jgi:hypothetical protein
MVEIARAETRATGERDVTSLDHWAPRPSEMVMFADSVVGRYRTSRSTTNAFGLWDLAVEPPIERDERVRAEMAKIFEGAGDQSAPQSSLDWARRLGQ